MTNITTGRHTACLCDILTPKVEKTCEKVDSFVWIVPGEAANLISFSGCTMGKCSAREDVILGLLRAEMLKNSLCDL